MTTNRWIDRLWWIALGVSVGLLLLVAGCGGSSPGATPARTGVTEEQPAGPSAAAVTALEVPGSVACNGATSTTIPVTYATTGAARQEIYVDGRPEALAAASGSVIVPVHCDALPHSVVVIAYDDRGRRAARSVKVSTVL